MSRGQIPLPWLRSNDALPLATRIETRLPWRPTRGSLPTPVGLSFPISIPPCGLRAVPLYPGYPWEGPTPWSAYPGIF